ncbi:MAG: alpha/beta hydrolase [Flavobacteriaceae bacterium]|jgi:pimeloyl-ACP methyl ester carboxylesterase|nr:alpha/beta hydrolase [Flavobacteriaceae bacterium]
MTRGTTYYKNITLSYLTEGEGPTIVLLHGFLESALMWKHITPYLAQKHQIIAIDLLGHGETKNLSEAHSMDDMADAVHATLVDTGVNEAIFIGHSMGGYVALSFAEHYTEMVKRMVLIASTTKADSEERKSHRTRAIELVKKNSKAFVTMATSNLFQDHIRPLITQEIEDYKEEALKVSTQGIIAALQGMKDRPDREVLLYTSTFPISAIMGTLDTIMPIEENIMQYKNADIKTTLIEAGHMLHIEKKDDLLKAILNDIN